WILDRAVALARWKQQREQSPASGVVQHRYVTAMSPHGFFDDGEAETGTFLLWLFAAPESIKYPLAVLCRDATAVVCNSQPGVGINGAGDLSSHRRVQHAVLDEVPDRVCDRVAVRVCQNGLLGADKSDRAFPGDGPRCCHFHGRAGDLVE